VLDDELLTIEEVAAYLKLRPQTIYKWAQQKRLPGAKFGKEWRFKRSEILAWVNDQIKKSRGDGAPVGDGKRLAGGSKEGAAELERGTRRARGARKRKEVGPETN